MTPPFYFLGIAIVMLLTAFLLGIVLLTVMDRLMHKRRRILILGHGRHGKDQVAELLKEECGINYASSSLVAAEAFIYDELKDKFGYKNFEECYEDRNSTPQMRAIWHDLICEYNEEDPTRLAKEVLSRNDCYVGMRSNREITACLEQGLFEFVILVDASKRLDLESPLSFDVDIKRMQEQGLIDFTVHNHTFDPELKSLRLQIKQIAKLLP